MGKSTVLIKGIDIFLPNHTRAKGTHPWSTYYVIKNMRNTRNIISDVWTAPLWNHNSSLFGRASTPGQSQTGLGPRVYPFITTVLPGSDAGSNVFKPASIEFRHPKPSDLVAHKMSNVFGTLLERSLRFVQRRRTRNLVKEWDLTCAWTNGIVHYQSAGHWAWP